MPDPTPDQARRLVETARANTERHAPELLTPPGATTAELLARLEGAGVNVPIGGISESGEPFIRVTQPGSMMRYGGHNDSAVRAIVTVAALEVVHGAGHNIAPPRQARRGGKSIARWTLWMQRDSAIENVSTARCVVLDAPDLAAAAVEAACRIREAGR